jgi:NADH dehydrogenase
MVLVVGATGSLGRRIVHRLRAQDEDVRALVRPASDWADLERAGAQIALGDLKEPQTLDRACAGVDVVVSTANSAKRGGADNVETVDLNGNRNLIDAAARAGVHRFIFVSVLGVSADSPVPFLRAKAAAEQHLRESGLEYTIIAPNIFMDVWLARLIEAPVAAGQPVTLVGEAARRHTFVAEDDVAAFATAAVRSPVARNAHVLVGGPEALSFRDAVRIYERALGREIPVRTVAPGEPIPGVPPAVQGLVAAFETYDSPLPMEETARRFGLTLASVEDRARNFAASQPPPLAH